MLKELQHKPESGFLGCTAGFPAIIQYWRSFEHLEAWARSKDGAHWPAWVAFNKRSGGARGDVGIWLETYRVAAGQYEAFYSGMPAIGLGKIGRLVPATVAHAVHFEVVGSRASRWLRKAVGAAEHTELFSRRRLRAE